MEKGNCKLMFVAILFTISKRYKQSNCHQQMNKQNVIYTLNGIFCCCLVTKLCLTLCNTLDCNTPGFPGLHYLPEFAQTHIHWVSDTIQPPHPLSPSSPPAQSFPASGSFQWVCSSHWPKYWCFSISSFNEYSGLIYFRTDWFDLLPNQGTLKSLFQHQSSKA